MKPIRVNADYESVLFHQKPSEALSHPIETLALFLEERPLLTGQIFSREFLDYVKMVTGREPQIARRGEALNWWGSLDHIALEVEANSKMTSAELVIREGWCRHTKILPDPAAAPTGPYLIKSNGGMSGRGIWNLGLGPAPQSLEGPCVLEPFLERLQDFSHFRFPTGKLICYQNFVDQRFQYRGTLFPRGVRSCLSDLTFYPQLAPEIWEEFRRRLSKILEVYLAYPLAFGFSVDSFTYRVDGGFGIRALSEVNHRRTMGACAFGLAQNFGGGDAACGLVLGRGLGDFQRVRDKLETLLLAPGAQTGIVILSPGKRFEMFYFQAPDAEAARGLLRSLAILLPEAELSVSF